MKILIITSRFPYPIEKGDKLRIFYQIKELAKNHELILCALSEEEINKKDYNEVAKYCSAIHIFKRSKFTIFKNILRSFFIKKPMQVGYFYDKKIDTHISNIINDVQPEHIYCQLLRTAEYVKNTHFPKTIDYMDTFSIGAKRWANHANFLLKPFLKREARLVSSYEHEIFDWFNHHTIISEQDRNLLDFNANHKVSVIPNGVDTNFFKPISKDKKYDLVFVGNMGYKPNVEAVNYLAKEILPVLINQNSNLKLLIAGARPSPLVQRLASSNVIISGWVDDIRESYASGKIFVAPLFLGSGQQNKILEAMAMGIPCITTDLVNNAIGATPNQEILIANSPNEFIHKINQLQDSDDLYRTIASNGLSFVSNNFSWKAFVRKLEILFESSLQAND